MAAALRSTAGSPPGPPADCGCSPGRGTTTCSPSVSTRARLIAARSASGPAPPAASIASASRDPAGRWTSPGWSTWPTTCTTTSGAAAGAAPTVAPEVVVHVVGQVLQPGLVHLPAGSRLADAIDAAGGAGPEADLAAINLARVLTDGEQVVVPRPGEQPPSVGAAGADPAIDLNTAATADLDTLPGIGPVLAQRIVDWRTEHGAFTAVDELAEVRGIGSALLEGLHDLVRVG